MRPWAARCLAVAATFHLGMVAFGAAGRAPLSEVTLLGRLLGAYGAYTGADARYGYFAPGVASERQVILHVFLGGDRWVSVPDALPGRESSLRLATVAGLFANAELRQPLAASWAARAFGSFPAARLVLVEVKIYVVPTMRDRRRGELPRWRTEEIFPFARVADPAGARR